MERLLPVHCTADRRALTWVLIVGLALALANCSTSADSEQVGERSATSTSHGGDQPEALGSGPVGLDGLDGRGRIEDLDAVLASARELGLAQQQIDALSDGEVTYAEHESLVRLTLQCMKEAGFDAVETGIGDSGMGVETLRYAWGGAGSETAAGISAGMVCENRFSLPAVRIYVAQNAPPLEQVQAEIDARFIEFGRCLVEAGVAGVPDISEYDAAAMQDQLLSFVDDPRHACSPP